MDTPRETTDTPDDQPETAVAVAEPDQESRSNSRLILILGGVALVAVLLFALASGGSDSEPASETAAGDSGFASLVFLNADGTEGSLADYSGQPLVVNFFAAWCPPCRAELPEFEAVSQANSDRVRFIGVSHDLDQVTWRSLIEETGVTFDTVFQPNQELFEAFDAKGMPTTAFISPDGEVLQVWTGILSDDKLQELIDENLAEA